MPQNTDYKAANSGNQAMSDDKPLACGNAKGERVYAYKERLNSWAVVRLLPDTQREIIARFRSRSDADGYMQHIRQLTPNATFMVVFDCQRDEAVI